MNQLSELVVPIKYIGQKEQKFDTVNHSGTSWRPGQTLLYPAKLAKALLVHTDVWRLGKKEDVRDASEDAQTVVAAAAGESASGAAGQGRGSLNQKEPREQTQSQEMHDRTPSARGNSATLE